MSSFVNGFANNFPIQVSAVSALALASDSVLAVPASTPSTIVTYTPVSDKKITRIAVSGTNYAKIELFVNSTLIETKRMGPDRNVDFIFTNPLLLAGSVPLDVKATHYTAGTTIDFESTIYGV